MNFEQHKNYGVSAALCVSIGYYIYYASKYFSQTGQYLVSEKVFIYSLLIFFITVAGSLAPDLDTKSTTTRFVSIFMAILWGLIIFSNLLPAHYSYYAGVASFLLFMCLGTKHRSFTHALGWPAIALLLSAYTKEYMLFAFGCGLIVHAYCDAINPFELRNWWFNPFKKSFWI